MLLSRKSKLVLLEHNLKVCFKCDEIKPLSEFTPKRILRGLFHYHSYCKSCANMYAKNYYKNKRNGRNN